MKKLKAMVVDDSKVMRLMVMKSLRQTNLADFEFEEAEEFLMPGRGSALRAGSWSATRSRFRRPPRRWRKRASPR